MKVGTIETLEEEKRKRRVGLSSGFGSGGSQNNNGGGGNDGGGGGNKKDDYIEETENYPSNKFRIGMWFLLLVVMMTFGGLMSAYIVVATKGLEWKPFNLPRAILISTALILASSVTYKIARNAINRDNQTKAKNWLLATTIFGGMFIASQMLAWLELVQSGVYMESNPYAGFFYILTAVHAVHVIGGIAGLGYILLRMWQPTDSDDELVKRQQISGTIGWYWHFMDGLWIVLVSLLAFWK